MDVSDPTGSADKIKVNSARYAVIYHRTKSTCVARLVDLQSKSVAREFEPYPGEYPALKENLLQELGDIVRRASEETTR